MRYSRGEKKGKVEKKTCICSPGAGVQVVEQSHQMVVGMVTRDGKKKTKTRPSERHKMNTKPQLNTNIVHLPFMCYIPAQDELVVFSEAPEQLAERYACSTAIAQQLMDLGTV